MKLKLILSLFLATLTASINAKGKLPSNVDKTEHWTLTSTYYHAVKSQCDDTPNICASGIKVNYKALKSGKQKICALSRDLLKLGFKYGDRIYIEELNAIYIIADTMHKRFSRHIDILQHTSHKPMPYTKLTIRKVINK